jgi:alkyldihydroxyacetonephosphate synthase
MYDLTRSGNWPASARLVDNLQFQLSQTLKPKKSGLGKLKSNAEKLFVTKVKGFDVDKMVACTLVFEGNQEQVASQEETVKRLSAQHKGMAAGAENGKRGYQLTYGIAYIRDFIMRKYILAESFETSMPWDKVLPLVEQVKARITEEHHKRNLPGVPFITARITQIYDTGAVVYFYFAFYHKGVENPSQVYAEIEHAARDEILKAGGSLSHHHGIGHLRKDFLPRIFSDAALGWNRQLKAAVDPGNNFGTGSQAINDPLPASTDTEEAGR